MSLPGLKFNGEHSSDYGLIMRYFIPQPPAPKKIKAEVPFMDSVYDFSTIATNGEKVYRQRKIKVGFTILAGSKGQLHGMYANAMRWLVESPQSQLIVDFMSDVYYLAEVEDAPDWDEEHENGEFEVDFIAEPFKYGVETMSNQTWDLFNFETDALWDMGYIVSGTQNIQVYNPGRTVTPTINSNAIMTAELNGYTMNLSVGDNKDYRFRLKNGYNTITTTGTGILDFKFRKEVF